jgi:hypothetical protein
MERGAYRTRAPLQRLPMRDIAGTSQPTVPRRPKDNLVTNSHLAMLVVLLAFSCLSCFGAAYYLFVTRWEASVSVPLEVADQQPQVVSIEFHQQAAVKDDPHEKYLTYLPHSGFHNQRIAFENALVLSRILNRTLLMPPIRLGDKPLRYVNFDALYQFIVLSDKHGLYHCSRVPSYVPTPLECLDYFGYTHITWDWLVNLTDVAMHQRLLQRWNMTDAWIREQLKMSEEDVLTIKDSTPYQYRFLDTLSDISPSSHKFSESLYLPNLAMSTQRLLNFGTLFGSSRLRLKNATNICIRGNVRQSMSYSNPSLIRLATSMAKILGDPYLGAHVRLGDGEFRRNAEDNVRLIWWKLLHQVLEYTLEETSKLEYAFRTSTQDLAMSVPDITVDLKGATPDLSLTRAMEMRSSLPNLHCRGRLHVRPQFLRLNTPLFISTDVQNPLVSPLLARFHKTFPCTFYLSDFTADLASLEQLRNADDGVMLGEFLLPFLDAMVVAHAWKVVGTEKSTFSSFVQDVLWRRYHGRPIVQRG